MLIAFINQKGGCSKSTTSLHFAYWLRAKGKKVLLIDADGQGSSSAWAKGLADPLPMQIISDPPELLEKLPALKLGEYEYIIADGPGALAEVSRAILCHADLVVVPCQASALDVHSVIDTVRAIKQVQGFRPPNTLKTAAFASRVVQDTKLLTEVKEALQSSGLGLLNATITQRQAVADTFGQLTTVWGMNSSGAKAAAAEYEKLFSEILATAGGAA